MTNYFQGNSGHPQHISVGAIAMNEKGEVRCHHVLQEKHKGYWGEGGLDDIYLLMRETVDPNETLEDALHRGLMEEFGMEVELIDYIGSIQGHFKHHGVEVEKTTLYFLCQMKSEDLSKRRGDAEAETDLEWRIPDFLIPKMKQQTVHFGRTDIDESSILERAKKYLR